MIQNPPDGDPITAEAEDMQVFTLQTAATVDGNGTAANITGLVGQALVEIANSGTGTTTIAIEGSFDQANWYAAGYQQIDGIAAPARATAVFSVAASPARHVLQVLDHYPLLRARMTGTLAGPSITATLRQFPQ